MEGKPIIERNELVPYEQSFKLAVQLMDRKRQGLALADNENFGRSDIPDFIQSIPDTIKSRFFGHGITREGKYRDRADRLAAFINILDNNTIKGDYGPLLGGQPSAYTNVDLLILSHLDKHLGTFEGVGEPVGGSKLTTNNIGWVADVGAYVVGNKYSPIIDELKKLYPNKNIIRADEISDFVSEEIRHKNS
jgi:hypothetical protein